jgi:hypothetical protein
MVKLRAGMNVESPRFMATKVALQGPPVRRGGPDQSPHESGTQISNKMPGTEYCKSNSHPVAR